MRQQLWVLSNILLLGLPWMYRRMFPSAYDDRIRHYCTVRFDQWNYPLKELVPQLPQNEAVKRLKMDLTDERSWFPRNVEIVFTDSEADKVDKIAGITLTRYDEFVTIGGEGRLHRAINYFQCPSCKGKYTAHYSSWNEDEDEEEYSCTVCEEMNYTIDSDTESLAHLGIEKIRKLLAQGKVVVRE